MFSYNETTLEGNDFLVVWEMHDGSKEIGPICDWLKDHKEAIDQVLHHQGALLIRGLENLKTAIAFEQAITAISTTLMSYVGGTTPRQTVRGNIMTATEIPSAWSISLHQEMSYTRNPPDRIAFFCLESAPKGGDSTLGDMRLISSQIDKDLVRKFKKHGVQLRRTLLSADTLYKKPGVQKSWNEVLGVSSREQAELVLKKSNWRAEWLDTETLQLWQEILPATKTHAVNKAEVWFNQTHKFAPAGSMAWAKRDGRQENLEELIKARKNNPEILDAVLYGNGEYVSDEEAVYLFDLFKASEVNVKLRNTDLLILDNTLVAHGRSPFSGKRKVLVALMN